MPSQRQIAGFLAIGHAVLAGFFVVLRHFTPTREGF